jgi:hypothetical protein
MTLNCLSGPEILHKLPSGRVLENTVQVCFLLMIKFIYCGVHPTHGYVYVYVLNVAPPVPLNPSLVFLVHVEPISFNSKKCQEQDK